MLICWFYVLNVDGRMLLSAQNVESEKRNAYRRLHKIPPGPIFKAGFPTMKKMPIPSDPFLENSRQDGSNGAIFGTVSAFLAE